MGVKRPVFWGILLCGIIIFGATISTVKANSVFPNSIARIYGSLDGTPGYPPGSPPQIQTEKNAAIWVGQQLVNDFAASGYTASDLVGSGTSVQAVIGNALNDENNYDRCTVFQFGHMVNYDEGYVDDTGNIITPGDISPNTQNGNYQFVFLWVCAQANGGNPTNDAIVNAWLNHPEISSNDGYNYPDNTLKCYIGFSGFSPLIGDTSGTFQNQNTLPMEDFIQDFYYNALINGYDLRDSLNQASLSIFSTTYTSCVLASNYMAWYPGDQSGDSPGYYSGQMQVWGDGAAFLFQPTITFTANNGLSPTFYLDNQPCNSQVNVWDPEVYTISASSIPGYTFDHFSYDGQNLGNPANVELLTSGTITAYYDVNTGTVPLTVYAEDQNGYGNLPLYIDGHYVGDTGYTYYVSPGNHQISVPTTLYPPYPIVFQYYYYNGVYNYNDPMTLSVTSPETVTAYYLYE